MSAPFVHLNLHSEYSIVDGIVRIKPLLQRVKDFRMPAVAITDHSNVFALVKFYQEAMRQGIKPLVGAELSLVDSIDGGEEFSVILLCQSRQGYRNLCNLITRAYQDGQQRGKPRVLREWVGALSGELIALSGAESGDVGQALLDDNEALVRARLEFWQRHFPDRYYLELRRSGRPGEDHYLQKAVALALEYQIPPVATNAVRYLEERDFEAHEARVCIHNGDLLNNPNRQRNYSAQQYLRSPQEMRELFADLPEAVENTLEIAHRCNFDLQLENTYLPDFVVPAGQTVASQLQLQASAGLDRILAKHHRQRPVPQDREARYRQRLATELQVINDMGFAGYFLIVADFIDWAWKNDVPVGPGRGSGAGSLVAYCLGITRIDPLEYGLLFERFLNPERVSLPDFDIDFCMDGRDRVIDYVAGRYGRDRVSQIITYGTMAAKAVVRDVGRVLGQPYGFVDSIAKLVPMELHITLDKALQQEPELQRRYREEEDVHTLIDLARSLEGVVRNAGKHAGGVVIAPSALTDFTPLYCEPGGGHPVTQFDKDDVEAVGLVKFDFLGLRTLTIIDWAVRNIRAANPELSSLDIDQIPLNDRPTYEMLMRGETTAVFQLESRGMKELIGRLLPDCFEDIVALVALFRPGPLQSGMVDDFINRKHGKAEIDYLEPRLRPVLHDTYGVILYQEQVMQIAQILAGYSLGQADLLRRAMGKKKPEEMAKQRFTFIRGAEANGVSGQKSGFIFDLMEKFAGYGFNKSHSAAYAQVAYQTAWLKTRHPAAFMAATLSADLDNTDKVVDLLAECKAMSLAVQRPDINTGHYHFLPTGERDIRYGLGAIRGVGRSAIDSLLAEREANGPFQDLFQLCERVDPRKTNRRVLEALLKAGALDSLGGHRAALLETLPRAIDIAEQQMRDRISGQNDLFGLAGGQQAVAQTLVEIEPWPEEDLLKHEREVLGCYLSGHPVNFYADEQAGIARCRLADLAAREGQQISVLGQIVAIRAISRNRSGAVLTLEDGSGRVDLVVFHHWDSFRETVEINDVIIADGKVSKDRFNGNFNLQVEGITGVESAREKLAKRLHLVLGPGSHRQAMAEQLKNILAPYTGGPVRLTLDYSNDRASGRLDFGDKWRVHPRDELLRQLRRVADVQDLEIVY